MTHLLKDRQYANLGNKAMNVEKQITFENNTREAFERKYSRFNRMTSLQML